MNIFVWQLRIWSSGENPIMREDPAKSENYLWMPWDYWTELEAEVDADWINAAISTVCRLSNLDRSRNWKKKFENLILHRGSISQKQEKLNQNWKHIWEHHKKKYIFLKFPVSKYSLFINNFRSILLELVVKFQQFVNVLPSFQIPTTYNKWYCFVMLVYEAG